MQYLLCRQGKTLQRRVAATAGGDCHLAHLGDVGDDWTGGKKWLWKITISMGKSTISMGHFLYMLVLREGRTAERNY